MEDTDFYIVDDESDATYSDEFVLSETDTALADTTIGIPQEILTAKSTVDRHFTAALDTLADAGTTVKNVSVSNISLALPAWAAIACTEFVAYLDSGAQNYWLEGGGGVIKSDTVKEALIENTADLNRTLQSILVVHEHLTALNKQFYDQARLARRRVINGFAEVFEEIDCLATPTMPQIAPRWDETDDGLSLFESVANTAPCNVAGLPAVSVPCGRAGDVDLPVGL